MIGIMSSEEPKTGREATVASAITPARIVLIGVAAAVAVVLGAVCVQVAQSGRGADAGAVLPQALSPQALAYVQWRPQAGPAPDAMPAAWAKQAGAARERIVLELAKQLRAEPDVVQQAWAHVRRVEVGASSGNVTNWAAGDEPVVAALHFEPPGYLAAFLNKNVPLAEPMQVRGGKTYRIASTLFLTPLGDVLLLTRNLVQMEDVLSRRAAADARRLGGQPAFVAATRAYARGRALWGVLNPNQLRLSVRRLPIAPDALRAAPPITFALQPGQQRLRASATVCRPPGPAGASVLGSLRNTETKSLLRFAPTDTAWFAAVSMPNAAALWKAAAKLGAQATRKQGLRSTFDIEVEDMEKQLALDIEQDLLPALGTEAMVLARIDPATGKQSGVAAFDLAAPEAMLAALTRMESGPALRRVSYEDVRRQGYMLRIATLDEGPSYAVVDEALLVSNKGAALEAAVAAFATQRSLASDDALSLATADLPPKCAVLAGANAAYFGKLAGSGWAAASLTLRENDARVALSLWWGAAR